MNKHNRTLVTRDRRYHRPGPGGSGQRQHDIRLATRRTYSDQSPATKHPK
jgi:hypothetical protein